MSNPLAAETSPYLLQHADNPVDWHAWNGPTLDQARAEDKPILLSIGYSACHWCHVMAHESFEDEATAALMNQLFINIKVDREERPDIDRIYQTAHQLLTGRGGGWPLTCFLTPDEHVPIFIGTYFPKTSRYGLPSFTDVLQQVAGWYRDNQSEISARGALLIEALAKADAENSDPSHRTLSSAPVDAAIERLKGAYDTEFGGFGGAPKFPRTPSLRLLLGETTDKPTRITTHTDHQHTTPVNRAVMQTLDHMTNGGLYDQLGGGFFRYSVDRSWSIPHFEKMLYDNALLLGLYADVFAATDNATYHRVARETADWVIRDMQHPRGGYYAALDADSEGEEGSFYLWAPDEFEQCLSPQEATIAKAAFGLDGPPNFENHRWHLHRTTPPKTAASTQTRDKGTLAPKRAETAATELSAPPQPHATLKPIRHKLLRVRNARVWPARDDKVLAAWNGLMIRGMAKAARRLKEPAYAESATYAAYFIRDELWRHGRLLATWKDDRAQLMAYLDDYAFMADGLLELLQQRWCTEDLEFCIELVEAVLTHFEAPTGGFYFTADDHEKLLHRSRTWLDDALPSGNGIMLQVLLKLGALLGEQRYLDAAERGLNAAMASAEAYPDGCATVLQAVALYLEPPEIIVIRGTTKALAAWRPVVDTGFTPRRSIYLVPNDATRLPGLLGERIPVGEAVAYLCLGTQCRAPIHEPDQLRRELSADTP